MRSVMGLNSYMMASVLGALAPPAGIAERDYE
jgi:hypothetical protein